MEILNSILLLLAGIGVFMLGIKLMTNGLDKGAGKSIKVMFAKVGDNRFASAGIGAGATAAIQSSTAVTVMVVGFANAGVITLLQSTAIIMGANVGTTFTAFFGAIANLPINNFFMASGLVGVAMYMFGKKPKIKLIGEIIAGLALIFVGMHFMSRSFRDGPLGDAFQSAFVTLSGNPVGPLLLMLIGAVFTAILQSSTATTTMAVTMAAEGVLPLEAGIFLILGANIGTCLTAMIASIGASTNAKRAAVTHLMYNLIGAFLFLPLLWILRSQTVTFLNLVSRGADEWAAAFFHLFYNVILFALLIGFTKPLTALVTKLVPAKEGELSDVLSLEFIDSKNVVSLKGAEESVVAAAKDSVYKEIKNMAQMAFRNFEAAYKTTLVPDISDKHKIVSVEQKVNFLNKEIGRYLVRLSNEGAFVGDEKTANILHRVVSDIERIGDHAMNFLEEAEEMIAQGVAFTVTAVAELEEMRQTVKQMFKLSLEIFESGDIERLDEISKMRKTLSEYKRKLNFRHISRLNKEQCKVEAGVHFYAVVSNLEDVKDHFANIAYSVRNTKGAQLEQLKLLSKQKAKSRNSKHQVYW